MKTANKRIPWNKGKHWSMEIRQKISESMRGQKAPNLGIKHSEETRRKISVAMKKVYKLRNK